MWSAKNFIKLESTGYKSLKITIFRMSRFQESKVIVDQEPAKIIRLQPMAPPFCLGTRSP